MAKRGRPSKYTKALAAEICARIAEGDSVRTICLDSLMPSGATVFKWLAEKPEFTEQYAKAVEQRTNKLAEELLDIADDGSNDFMAAKDDEGGEAYRVNGEAIQRSRLRIDTRKWLLAKLQPKKYGDSLALTGKDGGAIEFSGLQVIAPKDKP